MKILIHLLLVLLSNPSFDVGSPDLAKAIQLYEHGDFRRAAELLNTQGNSTGEDEAERRLWLAKCYLNTQRWDDAVRELEKAVQLRPSNAIYHLWLGRAYGEKASRATLRAFGWARKVVKEFETAEKLSPDNLEVRFDLLEFYLEAPGLVGGGREKAETQAKGIAKRSARHGYKARARLYMKDKQWEAAKKELAQATVAYPVDPTCYADLAEFLLDQSDFQGAEANARQALKLNSVLPQARVILAAAHIELKKDLAEAEKSLTSLAAGPLRDEDPSFAQVQYWLGRCFLAQGKRSQARAAFETALHFDPDYSKAKTALSQAK